MEEMEKKAMAAEPSPAAAKTDMPGTKDSAPVDMPGTKESAPVDMPEAESGTPDDDMPEVEGGAPAAEDKKVYDGLKFSVMLSGGDMTDFMLQHNYSGLQGWVGVLISLAALVYLVMDFGAMDWSMRVVLAVIALLFTVVNPLMLIFKAKKQVRTSPSFKVPIDYTLADDVLVIEQSGQQLVVAWDELRMIKETKRSLVVYVTKMRAFLWPKEQLGAQYHEVTALVTEKMGAARARLKDHGSDKK